MIHAGFLYAACVATSAAGVWLSGQLSVQWRSHLAHLLHSRYCSNIALFTHPTSPLSHIDNQDQRITAETAKLCDSLASATRLAAGAPFRVLYYSYVAWQYLGFRGVFSAFIFFIVFAAIQKIAVVPLARTVVGQEKKEGNLRFLHLRLRERGPDVAASRGAAAELHSLDSSLQSALTNQRSVVKWTTAVSAVTKSIDYSGVLLNYALVGAAVFSGAAASAGTGGSSGEVAKFVSNASFASLSLIYSFTEMLDLGEQVSSLAALTARVVGLLELLPPLKDQRIFATKDRDPISFRNNSMLGMKSTITNTSSIKDQEMHPSSFSTMLCPPTSAVFLNEGGSGGSSNSSSIPMELSIHSLGRDLQSEVHAIFPDSFRQQNIRTPAINSENKNSNNQLLCVLTFQFAGNGHIDLSPDRSSPTLNVAAAEMDRLLENYIRWEAALRSAILTANNSRRTTTLLRESTNQGNFKNSEQNREESQNNATEVEIWCDSVDPRTGLPLHGTPSSFSTQRWSEVAAARALLHYDRRDAGVCPLVVHPVYGTSAYPVSFFTNASVEVLLEALSTLAEKSTESIVSPPLFTPNDHFSGASAFPASSPSRFLLSCHNLSLSTPDGRKPLISNLNFSLSPGQWLLISGPNGSGKTTLLRVLSGVHTPTAGTVSYNDDNGGNGDLFADPTVAMHLPQRPLSAPGPTLWQQISYPGTMRPLDHVVASILNDVGLEYLVEQNGGRFDASGPCSSLLESNYQHEIDNPLGSGGGDDGLSSDFSQDDEKVQEKWSSTLSPGELQRIAIARVLFHRPRLALLDEPCSAMDDTSAKKLLGLVRAANVTCIIVAQDTAMYREMHAVQLKLDGSGHSSLDILQQGQP